MKQILQYSIWAGLYAVLIIPFIVADSMFFPYIVGKAFTFRIIVEIIFGLWLILAIADKDFRPKFSWLLTSLGLFTFILLIADINAVSQHKALWSNFERMEGFVTIAHLFLYFVVLSSMFRTEKKWLWFFRANLGAGMFMAIYSLADGYKEGVVRVAGPLGNPIYIGVYFLFIFFISLVLTYKDVLTQKHIWRNVWLYIYAFIGLLSLYLTYLTSRGVFLGALGGIFVSTIIIALFERDNKLLQKISIGAVVIIVALVSLFFIFKDSAIIQNNFTLKRLSEISWNNITGNARTFTWAMAIDGAKEKPVLGWGQEGFNYIFNKNYDPRLYNQEQWFDRAHSAPLDALVAGGILGLTTYLGIFISVLYMLWIERHRLKLAEKAILTGLLAGYFVQGLFVFDTLMGYVMFVIILSYLHSHLVEDRKLPKLLEHKVNEETQNYILTPAIIVIMAVAIYLINVPSIYSNKNLIQAISLAQAGQIGGSYERFKEALAGNGLGDAEIREQLLSVASRVARSDKVDPQIKSNFVDLAYTELNKQIELVPGDARYYILLGAFLNDIGHFDKALPYLQKAVELSPRKQTIRFHLVRALVGLGRITEAKKEAQYIYDLEPSYEQAKKFNEAVQGLK